MSTSDGAGFIVVGKIPITEALDGKVVEWMEKVSDHQYLGKQLRRDARV